MRGAFCADAHALFQAALANRGSLMSFVDAHAGAADIGNICVESRPAPVLAAPIEKPATPVKAIAVAAVATPAAAAAATPKPAAASGGGGRARAQPAGHSLSA